MHNDTMMLYRHMQCAEKRHFQHHPADSKSYSCSIILTNDRIKSRFVNVPRRRINQSLNNTPVI